MFCRGLEIACCLMSRSVDLNGPQAETPYVQISLCYAPVEKEDRENVRATYKFFFGVMTLDGGSLDRRIHFYLDACRSPNPDRICRKSMTHEGCQVHVCALCHLHKI